MARFNVDPARLNFNVERKGKEYNLRLLQRAQSIFSTLLSLLPSNYTSTIQGPNFTIELKAVAVEIARIELALEDVNLDLDYTRTRSEFLYGTIGYLCFLNNRLPSLEFNDTEFRQFLINLIRIYFQGSIPKSIKDAVGLFLTSDFQILENFLLVRQGTAGLDISDQFGFQIDVATGNQFPAEIFDLQSSIRIILDIVRPAHTLFSVRFIFQDEYKPNEDAGGRIMDSMRWKLSNYYYEDYRRYWSGLRDRDRLGTKECHSVTREIHTAVHVVVSGVIQTSFAATGSLAGLYTALGNFLQAFIASGVVSTPSVFASGGATQTFETTGDVSYLSSSSVFTETFMSPGTGTVTTPFDVPQVVAGHWWDGDVYSELGLTTFRWTERNGHTGVDMLKNVVANQPDAIMTNGFGQFRFRNTSDPNQSSVASANTTRGWTGATYIGMWVRYPDGEASIGTNILFRHNGAGGSIGIYLRKTTTTYRLILSVDGTATTDTFWVMGTTSTAWRFFELVYDPAEVGGLRARLFIDGVERAYSGVPPTPEASIFDTSATVQVACIGGSPSVDTTDIGCVYYCNGIPTSLDRLRLRAYKSPISMEPPALIPEVLAGEWWTTDLNFIGHGATSFAWHGRNGTNNVFNQTALGNQPALRADNGQVTLEFTAGAQQIAEAVPRGPGLLTTGPVLVGFWARFDGPSTATELLVSHSFDTSEPTNLRWMLIKWNTQESFELQVSANGTVIGRHRYFAAVGQGWHYYEVALDMSQVTPSDRGKLFVDRVQLTPSVISGMPSGTLFPGTADLRIGNNAFSNQDFQGRFGPTLYFCTGIPSTTNRGTLKRYKPPVFCPETIAAVTAWLHLTTSIATAGLIDSVVDVLGGSPAIGTTTSRPTLGYNGNIIPFMSTDGGDRLLWPLGAGNNGVVRCGFAFWYTPVDIATTSPILVIRSQAGGASGEKLSINQNGSGLKFFAFDVGLRRDADTASGVLVAGTPVFITVEYDGAQSTDATKVIVTINGAVQALTFSGAAASMPASLNVVTGNASLFAHADGTSPLPGGARLGANVFALSGTVSLVGGGLLTSAERSSLMGYEPMSISPSLVPAVGCWLELANASTTITGGNYSSVHDVLNPTNPATQVTVGNRPGSATSANGLPILNFGGDDFLIWPLNTANNSTTTTGWAGWVRPTVMPGTNKTIWAISDETAGAASNKKFQFFVTASGRLNLSIYEPAGAGYQGRNAQTGNNGVILNTWQFITLEYNSAGATEADRTTITRNGVVMPLTFANIVPPIGTITTLRSVTGNSLLGSPANQAVPFQAFQGHFGPNVYVFDSLMVGATSGLLTTEARSALMNYQVPT